MCRKGKKNTTRFEAKFCEVHWNKIGPSEQYEHPWLNKINYTQQTSGKYIFIFPDSLYQCDYAFTSMENTEEVPGFLEFTQQTKILGKISREIQGNRSVNFIWTCLPLCILTWTFAGTTPPGCRGGGRGASSVQCLCVSHRGIRVECRPRYRCSGRISLASPSACSPARSWSAPRCPRWTPPRGGSRARARRGLRTGRLSRLQKQQEKTALFSMFGERHSSNSKFPKILQVSVDLVG